jgi:hypothetical protein
MRRILLVALLGTVTAGFFTGAALAKPKSKPATFKTGTYSAKVGPEKQKLSLTLKRANCASAPGQAKSPLHLCLAMPASPKVGCTMPVNFEVPLGFTAPVQLPSSGKVTQQAPIAPVEAFPGSPPTTGQSTFAVTFTKKGTASGYFEVNLMIATTPTEPPVPCSSGKVPFTAKLG